MERSRRESVVAADGDSTEEEAVAALLVHAQARLRALGLVQEFLPDADSTAKCAIFVSEGWESEDKLLLILQNAVGARPGLWSRSLCLSHGLTKGSMLPCVERARAEGMGVVILNPNTNSVQLSETWSSTSERAPEMTEPHDLRPPAAGPDSEEADGRDTVDACETAVADGSVAPSDETECVQRSGPRRVPIESSSSPVEHTLSVMDIIRRRARAKQVFVLAYGAGATLAKDIVQLVLARAAEDVEPAVSLTAIVTVEASAIIDAGEDAADTIAFMRASTLNLETSLEYPAGYRLLLSKQKQGCTTLSLGALPDDVTSVAWSVSCALPTAFSFFRHMAALPDGRVQASPEPELFARAEARARGLVPDDATSPLPPPPAAHLRGMGRDLVGGVGSPPLTIFDFDLLRVVGKGAFGKVMLVRKRKGLHAGEIFALKVMQKSVVVAHGQQRHALAERTILERVSHPFIVQLRFAFQNDQKLYLVTSFYPGGNLFFHLRRSGRGFDEPRARFYAAELALALEHLHSALNVIYRDLKLENVLLDEQGHVALTDFGLSKCEGPADDAAVSTTFCGTPEYVAPEMLQGLRYSRIVDWWSFGVLVFEMLGMRTPFFNRNRRVMYTQIVTAELSFTPAFSPTARDLLRQLLTKSPARRLGIRGVRDIQQHAFFASIDWGKLERRECTPPYKPSISSTTDVRYVPSSYQGMDAKEEQRPDQESESPHPRFEGYSFAQAGPGLVS